MPIPTGGLITRLDFSNPASYPGSGTAVYDLSANNNDFAFQNTNFTYSTVFGGEVFIDSSNILKTSVPLTSFGYGTTAFTINIWMQQHTEGGANLSMFNALSDTGGAGPAHGNLYFGTQTGPTFFVTDGTDVLFQNTTFPLNEWKMITITKPANGGSDSIKVYIDGSQITFTSSGTSTPISLASSNCYIDSVVANLGVWSLDMTVGEYAVWNVELTSGQVSTYYNETRYRFYKQLEYDFQNGSYPGSGTSIFDLSGNGITANILSGGTYVSGNVNYIDLQGNTNIFTANANIPTNTSLTINAWIQPEFQYPSSGYGNWWSTGNDGSGTIPFLGLSNVGGTNVIVSGGYGAGTTQSFNSANFDPSKWYYYSVVSSSSTGTSLFVNGSLVGTNAGWIRPQVGNFRIGTYDDPTSATKGYGKVAYVDFYNVALTGTEILANYNASAALYDNLIAKYDLNDPLSYSGTGSTLYDLSENNYDITLSNTTYTSTANYNSLIFLKGSSSKGTYVGDIGLGTTTPIFTYAMWVKPTDLVSGVNYGWFLSYGKELFANGGAPGLFGEYAGANNYSFSFGSGKGLINSGQSLTLNQWYFLTATCDGTDIKLYLDGSYLGTTSLSPGAINAPQELAINYLTQTSVGYISFELNYLEIYDKALTAGEISTIYNNTVSRFAPAPPAYQGIVGGRQFAQGFNG